MQPNQILLIRREETMAVFLGLTVFDLLKLFTAWQGIARNVAVFLSTQPH
jgi:hypothetical protein